MFHADFENYFVFFVSRLGCFKNESGKIALKMSDYPVFNQSAKKRQVNFFFKF